MQYRDQYDRGNSSLDRRPYDDDRRRPYEDDRRRPYEDDRRRTYDDDRRRPYDDDRRRPYEDEDRRRPYNDDRRRPYDDDRRHPYNDDRRDPYYDDRRRPYNDDRRDSYDDRRPFGGRGCPYKDVYYRQVDEEVKRRCNNENCVPCSSGGHLNQSQHNRVERYPNADRRPNVDRNNRYSETKDSNDNQKEAPYSQQTPNINDSDMTHKRSNNDNKSNIGPVKDLATPYSKEDMVKAKNDIVGDAKCPYSGSASYQEAKEIKDGAWETTKEVAKDAKDLIVDGVEKAGSVAKEAYNKTKEMIAKF